MTGLGRSGKISREIGRIFRQSGKYGVLASRLLHSETEENLRGHCLIDHKYQDLSDVYEISSLVVAVVSGRASRRARL